jgi:hypothetical protein
VSVIYGADINPKTGQYETYAYDPSSGPYSNQTVSFLAPEPPKQPEGGATKPAGPPTLDFSDEDSGDQSEVSKLQPQSQPEQQPVNAKAYYASQGQSYAGGAGTAYEDYTTDWTPDLGTSSKDEEQPFKGGQRQSFGAAPTDQPYTPPSSVYSSPGYGGVGAAGDTKSVWGASYGGMGEDPFLKSMKSFAQPFQQFFAQMQLDHF